MNKQMGLGLLTAMILGCGVGAAPPAVPAALGGGTALAASPQAFSFGNVPVGTSTTRDVTLSNTGTAAAQITDVTVTGPGFSATGMPVPLTLAPGASTTLTVGFAPPATGIFAGDVILASAAVDLVVIAPTGTGVTEGTPPAASIDGVTVNPASVVASQTVQMTATVAATGTIDKSVTWAVAAGSLGSIDDATGVYTAPSAAGSYTVTATSVADLTKRGSGTVTVTTSPPPTGSSLTANPSSVGYGSVFVGQTRAFPIVIMNTSGGPVTISQITMPVGLTHDLTVPRVLANGSSLWIGMRYTPNSATAISGDISFKDGGGANLLVLPVTGAGVALDGTNSVRVVDYGARGDGTTDDRASFQAAANAARDAGKVLLVPQPPGGQHYKLTGYVQIYGSVVGTGSPRPEIRMYGATGADNPGGPPPQSIFYFLNNTAATVITGLHLNGGASFAPGQNVYGLGGESSHALQLYGVSNCRVENNLIENPWGDGIILGGAPNTSPDANIYIAGNTIRGSKRCAVAVIDVNGAKVYLNALSKVVSYQGVLDFEPNYAPQADWSVEVAYNDFGGTLQYEHAVLTSNTATNVIAPGGNISVHDNWGAAGAYAFYVNLVRAGTSDAWVGNTIQSSLPSSPTAH